MKKIVALVCALGIAGMASAQIKPETAGLTMQRSGVMKMDAAPVLHAAKAAPTGIVIDSVPNEPVFNWEGYYTITWFGLVDGPDLSVVGMANTDIVPLIYGSYFASSVAGTGEIGYRFASGQGSYYNMAGYFPNLAYPVGAYAHMLRCPSTKFPDNDSMPVYFKLYNSTAVAPQQVMGDISGYSNNPQAMADVVYPIDPEKPSVISETVKYEVPEPETMSSGVAGPGLIYGFNHKAYFPLDNPQRMGDDFCLSVVFPNDGVNDEYWNAGFPILTSEGGSELISTNPNSVYFVTDFQKNNLWDSTLTERPDGMVDVSYQPNTRYAILPMSAYYFSDGSNLNAEFPLMLLYTLDVDLESPNPVDKYVNVAPVPAVENVTITAMERITRVELYSINGKLMQQLACNDAKVSLNVSNLNSGMYIAKVYTDGGVATKRIVVK